MLALAEWGVPRDAVVPRAELELRLPVTIGDYVDGYAGIHHATNLGRILRPESEPLLPNYRRIPVAYHGRAGTVVVSGTGVVRPHGPMVDGHETVLRPTVMLDGLCGSVGKLLGFLSGVLVETGAGFVADELREIFSGPFLTESIDLITDDDNRRFRFLSARMRRAGERDRVAAAE